MITTFSDCSSFKMKHALIFIFFLCSGLLQSQDTVKVALNLSPEQMAEQDYNKGLSALKNNDSYSAIDLFSKCLFVKPDFDKALANRAIAFTNVKKYKEALTDINKAITITPQNPDNYFNKSVIFLRLNLKDSQNVALDNCLKLNGEHAEASYYKGLLSFEARDFDKAIGYYSVAILSNRNYAFAYNDRASAKRAKGDLDGAVEDYEKALIVDSSFVFIYNNLGSAYRLRKSYSKAIETYTKALKLDPKYLTALINRGTARFEDNDLKLAQADFEEVLSIDSKNSSAYNNLCSIAIKNKDYKKARELSTRAIELDPKNGPAYYNRGIARQLLREEEACCADWKKALELGVTGAKAFINASCND
jgi:tetratricopeptide (TPR) repeat protein